MKVENGPQVVDPVTLARNSGFTNRQTFALPPVPRPFLLTGQLSGPDCACHNGGLGRGLGLVPIGSDPYPLPDGSVLGDIVPSAGKGNISILNAISLGTSFIPGVGPFVGPMIGSIKQAVTQFEQWLGIGAGRREADLIVPVQDNLVYVQLANITDQIRIGQNPDLQTLYDLYREVWIAGVGFVEYVLMKTFTDRRASGQALNTVMPYIDGTCGYPVPAGSQANPGASNCLTWGDGTIGGPGTNGILGALGRAIQARGGTVQDLPTVEQAANNGYQLSETPEGGGALLAGLSTPLAVALGIAAIYFFSKRAPRG